MKKKENQNSSASSKATLKQILADLPNMDESELKKLRDFLDLGREYLEAKPPQAKLTEEQVNEIKRRIRYAETHPDSTTSWEELRPKLQAKYGI